MHDQRSLSLRGERSGEGWYVDLIGKQFAYGGRGPDEYDCYGLCMEVCRRRGILLPDFGTSPSSPAIHGMIQRGKERFVRLDRPEPFCLVTFMIKAPYTSHVGVVLDDRVRFIHIFRKTRVCVERLDMPQWSWRTTGFYRLP